MALAILGKAALLLMNWAKVKGDLPRNCALLLCLAAWIRYQQFMADPNLRYFMNPALDLARASASAGGVPVGAVVVYNGMIVGEGGNPAPGSCDPTAHAEILAIRAAAAHLGRDRLNDCDLWVTLEPCAMCAGAIAHARIARLYFGAEDKKGGAVLHGPRLFMQPTIHHRPDVYHGIMQDECESVLKDFFAARR